MTEIAFGREKHKTKTGAARSEFLAEKAMVRVRLQPVGSGFDRSVIASFPFHGAE